MWRGLVYVGLVVILQVLVLFHCISFNFSQVQEVYMKVLLCLCHYLQVLNYLWCSKNSNSLIKLLIVSVVSSTFAASSQVCVCPWFVSCLERRFQFAAVKRQMMICRFLPQNDPYKGLAEGEAAHRWFPRSAWCLSLAFPLLVDDLHRE